MFIWHRYPQFFRGRLALLHQLEREGLLNNRPGRGVFVAAPRGELNEDARHRRLLEGLDAFLTQAVHLGFSEEEVLRLVAEGLSNREIGARIHLGEATVKTHLLHAFTKLDVNDRTRAVTRAMELGLL